MKASEPSEFTVSRQAFESLSDDQKRQCGRIFVDCFTKEPRFEKWTVATAITYLQSDTHQGDDFWLAVDNRKAIVGFALVLQAAHSHNAIDFPGQIDLETVDYISVLAINPPNQNAGIGTELLRRCVDSAKENGREAIAARTRLDAGPIRKLLEKSGFKGVRVFEAETGGVRSERELFVLSLKQPVNPPRAQSWKNVAAYCLQAISLPEEAVEELLISGRSIVRGLRSENDRVGKNRDTWRWKGWHLLKEDPRVEAEDWSALCREELFPLACSKNFRKSRKLVEELQASASLIPEICESSGIRLDVSKTDHLLCVNDHGSFLLIVRFALAVSPQIADADVSTLASLLFERNDRQDVGILQLLQNSSWGHSLRRLINEEVKSLCASWLRETILPGRVEYLDWNPQHRFSPKTVHTLTIYEEAFSLRQMESVHQIEEFKQTKIFSKVISEGRKDFFIQLGWSFTSVCGQTRRESFTLLRLLAELQMGWWFMRDCRRHLYCLADTINNSDLSGKRIESLAEEASTVIGRFNKFIIDRKRYRAAIIPREQLIVDELEDKWKLRDDYEIIRDMQDDFRQLARERAQRNAERMARRQSVALFIVAIVQLFSIVSMVVDYRSLMEDIEKSQPHHGLYTVLPPQWIAVLDDHIIQVITVLAGILMAPLFLPGLVNSIGRGLGTVFIAIKYRWSDREK